MLMLKVKGSFPGKRGGGGGGEGLNKVLYVVRGGSAPRCKPLNRKSNPSRHVPSVENGTPFTREMHLFSVLLD